MQTVSFAGEKSAELAIMCGVPRGSVLGPILFLLYCADVTYIAHRHGVHAHSYADDTQLYIHCNCNAADCATEAERLTACIEELDNWMTSNRLKLNSGKTQIIWIGTRQQVKKVVDGGR